MNEYNLYFRQVVTFDVVVDVKLVRISNIMEVLHITNNAFVYQCLVCSCNSLNTYVDLALLSSRTTHTETPLKDKIKSILKNKWIPDLSDSSFSLCLGCFQLIDQYDGLESQLRLMHEEICNKYISSHEIIQSVQTVAKSTAPEHKDNSMNIERTKRTPKTTTNKRKKFTQENNIPTLHAQIVQLEPAGARRDRPVEPPTLLQWAAAPVSLLDATGSTCGGVGRGAGGNTVGGSTGSGSQLLLTSLASDGARGLWQDAATVAGSGLRIFTVQTHSSQVNALQAPQATQSLQVSEVSLGTGCVAEEQEADDPGVPDVSGPSPADALASSVVRLGPPPLVLLPRPSDHPTPLALQNLERSHLRDLSQMSPVAPPPPPLPPLSPQPPLTRHDSVYLEALEYLRAGERVRVGMVVAGGAACAFCPRAFADAATLREHARDTHRPRLLCAALPPNLGLGERTNCGVHMADAQPLDGGHARPFACLFCDAAFKFKSNIHLHFKEKHTPHKPFACPDCKDAFRRSMELSRHRVYHCPLRKARAGPKAEDALVDEHADIKQCDHK